MAPTSQGPDAAQTVEAIITFLTLPPEVRLMVYRCLVPSGFVFDLSHAYANHWSHGIEVQPVPQLLDIRTMRSHPTCHQEVAALLYSTNSFKFVNTKDAVEWFNSIGAGNAQLVRRVGIPSNQTGRRRSGRLTVRQTKLNIVSVLEYQPRLQSFTLISCGPRDSSKWTVTDLRYARAVQKTLPSLTKAYLTPNPPDEESRYLDQHARPDPVLLRLTIESEGPRANVSTPISACLFCDATMLTLHRRSKLI